MENLRKGIVLCQKKLINVVTGETWFCFQQVFKSQRTRTFSVHIFGSRKVPLITKFDQTFTYPNESANVKV